MSSLPPSDSSFIWEDFQGDLEQLRGQITPPKKPWGRWALYSLSAVALIGAGIIGWDYYLSLQVDQSLASQGIDPQQDPNLAQVYLTLNAEFPSKEELKKAIQKALYLAESAANTKGQSSSTMGSDYYHALIEAMRGLLRFRLEGYYSKNNPEDQTFYHTTLDLIGSQTITYVDDNFRDVLPLLQTTHLQKQIKILQDKKAPAAQITELKQALDQAKLKNSGTLANAAYQLGLWLRYKHQINGAQKAFTIARQYVEGYEREGNYYQGLPPKQFSPLWTEYAASLENLAAIAYQGKLFRQARSYILRIFNTPYKTPNHLQYYSWEEDNLNLLSKRIGLLKQDLQVLNLALNRTSELPTKPLFQTSQHWVVNWQKLADRLRRTSFYSKKDPLSNEIWQALPPSIRSQFLLKSGISWLTPSLKSEILSILNTIIKKGKLRPDSKLFSSSSDLFSEDPLLNHQSKISSLVNHEVLNRKVFDEAFASELYDDFQLSDGTALHQSLNQEQKSQFLDLLQEDLQEAKSPEEKSHLHNLIEQAQQSLSPITIIDFKKFLESKIHSYQRKVTRAEKAYEQQSKHLEHIQNELHALESLDTLDTETILDLRKHELALKRAQLLQKFEKEQNQAKQTQVHQLIQSLFSGFQILLNQKQRELASLTDRYNRMRNESLSGNLQTIATTDSLLSVHEQLLNKLRDVRSSFKGKAATQLQREIQEASDELQVLRKEQGASPVIGKEQILESKQKQAIQDLESYMTPVRELTQLLVKRESDIKSIQEKLLGIRSEIIQLVGQQGKIGSIQKLSQKRTRYLLLNIKAIEADDLNGKIRQMNDQIQEEYFRLSYLIQQEKQLRTTLALLLPQTSPELDPLDQEELETLRQKLEEQEKLFASYQSIWREEELLSELELQETLYADALQYINQTIDSILTLEQNQVYDLNRAVQRLIQSHNERERIKRELQDFVKEDPSSTLAQEDELEAGGFYLDAARFFEYEAKLGWNLSLYEEAFTKRSGIVQRILSLVEEKQMVMEQKREAIASEDQLLIDELSPHLHKIERQIAQLGEQEVQVNRQIQSYTNAFQKKLKDSQAKRGEFLLTEQKARSRLATVQEKLQSHDITFLKTTQGLFKNFQDVDKLLTENKLPTTDNIDALLAQEESRVANLRLFYSQLVLDNFYKAKALWLLGLTYYEQASMESYSEATQATSIPLDQLIDEKHHVSLFYEAFEPELSVPANFQLPKGDQYEEESNQVKLSSWILSSENSAIEIFSNLLPNFITSSVLKEKEGSVLSLQQQRQLYLFFSEAQLLTGKIYLSRAKKQLQASHKEPKLQEDLLQKSQYHLEQYFDLQKNASLSFPTFYYGASPFQFKNQKAKRLGQASVLLAQILYLKKDYLQSIALLQDYLRNILSHDFLGEEDMSSDLIGVNKNIQVKDLNFQAGIDPFYSSALAKAPFSQYALYQLGLNYQKLAQNVNIETFSPSDPIFQEKEKYFRSYTKRALNYFTQLIQVELYSPIRSLALFHRAMLWKQLGNYESARSDLINLANLTDLMDQEALLEYGYHIDFPMATLPNKQLVHLELGKLYFENQDYDAATQAFQEASRGDETHPFIFEAKVKYADALFAQRRWVEAVYMYEQLVQEKMDEGPIFYVRYAPDIYLKMGQAQLALSSLSDAKLAFKSLFQFAPIELMVNDQLDLNSTVGFDQLTRDYRDSIRPLALASFYLGEIANQRQELSKARKHYQNAKKLIAHIPWKQDSLLRLSSQEHYQQYIHEWQVKTAWSLLKLECSELFSSTFSLSQQNLNAFQFKMSSRPIEDLIQRTREAISSYRSQRSMFQEMYQKLTTFRNEEEKKTSSYQKRLQYERTFKRLRDQGSPEYYRLLALQSVEKDIQRLQALSPTTLVSELIALYPEGSIENQILNSFALLFAKNLSLSPEQRSWMESSMQNLENLLTIPQFNETAKEISKALVTWVQLELSKTKMDPRFIPIDSESSIFTEVDYYRASCLVAVGGSDSYQQLTLLAKKYLNLLEKAPEEVLNPTSAWRIIEITANMASHQQDWEAAVHFYEPLLRQSSPATFALPEEWDRHQAQFYFAEALIETSSSELAQAVFMEDGYEKETLLTKVDQEKRQALQLFKDLSQLSADNVENQLIRIQAAEKLKELNI